MYYERRWHSGKCWTLAKELVGPARLVNAHKNQLRTWGAPLLRCCNPSYKGNRPQAGWERGKIEYLKMWKRAYMESECLGC